MGTHKPNRYVCGTPRTALVYQLKERVFCFMKRKSRLALLLALVVALSVPTAFAGSFFDYGNYGGAYYEINDSCTISSYSSTTRCNSNHYKVHSNVTLYFTVGGSARVNGQDALYSSTTSGTHANIKYINCVHYVDGVNVYTKAVYA